MVGDRSSSPNTRSSRKHFGREYQRFFSTNHICDYENPPTVGTAECIIEPAPSTKVDCLPENGKVKDDIASKFLDYFAQTIQRDVCSLISKVDDAENNFVTTGPNTASASTGTRMKKSNIMKRWEKIFEKEKERHRCRNGIRSKNNLKYIKSSSVEEQWNNALHRCGYPPIEQRSYNDVQSSTITKDEITTPIFGFPVNEQLSLEDIETLILNRKNEEDNQHPTCSQEYNKTKDKVSSDSINDKTEVSSEIYDSAILRSVALLMAMKSEDWRQFDLGKTLNIEFQGDVDVNNSGYCASHNGIHTKEQEFVTDRSNTNIHQFLQHVTARKWPLTTSIINLLLAHLAVSTDMENRVIGDGCLQIYKEMKVLAESGQYNCKPDSTTYRILTLVFSRRLQGEGEAIKLTQEMMENSSIEITPDLLTEAIRACRAMMQLDVAKRLMDTTLRNCRVRINVDSCIIFTEMMKSQNLYREAIDYFSRIQQVSFFENIKDNQCQ